MALIAPGHGGALAQTLMPAPLGSMEIGAAAARTLAVWALFRSPIGNPGLEPLGAVADHRSVGMLVEMEQAVTPASGAGSQAVSQLFCQRIQKVSTNKLRFCCSAFSTGSCHGRTCGAYQKTRNVSRPSGSLQAWRCAESGLLNSVSFPRLALRRPEGYNLKDGRSWGGRKPTFLLALSCRAAMATSN